MLEKAKEFAQQAVEASRNNLFSRLTLGVLNLTCSALTHGRFVLEDPAVKQGRMLLGATASESVALRNTRPDTLELPLYGMVYPRWGDAFDGIIEEAFRHKEADETTWKRGMLEAIAWQSYTSFSDIMAAAGRIDEACQNAEKATGLCPAQADTWFRRGLYAAMAGRLQAAAEYYRTGLELTPLAHEVWGNYASLLVNTGRRTEAQAYIAERLTILKAIPTLESARAGLMQAVGR